MRTNLRIWLSVLALFIVLSACEDHRIPASPRFRIKKVVPVNALSGPYQFYKYNGDYKYNSDGRLIEGAGFVMYYDEQGHLTKAETPGQSGRRYYYGVDTKGRILSASGRDFSPYGEFTKEEYRLEYDGQFPIRLIKATGSPAAQRQFTYADLIYSEGNISQKKIRITNENSGYDLSNTTETLQYDDKSNPFYGLILGDIDSRNFSKNNTLDTNYSYSYDPNGLLTRITLKYDGSTVQTFEYESY